MKIILAALATLIVSGCATTNSALDKMRSWTNNKSNDETKKIEEVENRKLNENERFLEYIVQTRNSAADSILQAKKWVASNFKGGTLAIQIDDPKNHRIVLKGFIDQCRAFGGIRPYEVSFLLQVEAKEKKARIYFDKILVTTYGQQSGNNQNMFSSLFHSSHPKTSKELQEVQNNCFDPLMKDLETEINTSISKTW